MSTVDKSICVLLASELPIVRLDMSAYLKDRDDIVSPYQAETLQQAVDQLADNHTDVVIVDLALLKPSGLADIRQLLKQDPGLKIIVLSRSEKEPFITQCMENGALGYGSIREPQKKLTG